MEYGARRQFGLVFFFFLFSLGTITGSYYSGMRGAHAHAASCI